MYVVFQFCKILIIFSFFVSFKNKPKIKLQLEIFKNNTGTDKKCIMLLNYKL